MTKVGIITFHNADNYGATVQAYALQTFLRTYGYEAYLIDYTSNYLKHPFGKENFRQKGLVAEILTLAGEFSRLPRKKAFNDFRSQYYIKTNQIKKSELWLLNNQFDLFITGSDQVWNDQISNADGAYFLDFVYDSSKKGSYAASFGFQELPAQRREWFVEKLQDFQYLNIREPSGANILKEILGRDSKVVLDPTLILEQKQWNEIAVHPPILGEYILTYQVGMDKNLLSYAKRLGKKLGCPIYSIPFPQGGFIKSHAVLNAGPREWLGWIQNAKYVVTDSFHGMALSIVFEREFMVCYSQLGRTLKSRQADLLNALEIKGHTLDEAEEEIPMPIDYTMVRKNLESLRSHSIEALLNMVKDK